MPLPFDKALQIPTQSRPRCFRTLYPWLNDQQDTAIANLQQPIRAATNVNPLPRLDETFITSILGSLVEVKNPDDVCNQVFTSLISHAVVHLENLVI